jgi:hypothetical protein
MVIFSLGFKTDFNVFLSVSSQCAISCSPSCLSFKKSFKEIASFNLKVQFVRLFHGS